MKKYDNMTPYELSKKIKLFAEVGELFIVEESLGRETFKLLTGRRGKLFRMSMTIEGTMNYVNIWRTK